MQSHFGKGSIAEFLSLSRLQGDDSENYLNGLTLENGTWIPNPYGITKWVDNVTKWPSIQWPDIYLQRGRFELHFT